MTDLAGRPVRYESVRRIDENIDAAMAGERGRPWQNKTLGQSQDVRPWIAGKTIDGRIVANLERFAGMLKPGDKVLDVGCYGGYCFGWLAARVPGLQYVGIDINRGTVEAAAAAHWGRDAAVFDVGDLFDLAPTVARHGPFDAALCLRVVIHTPWLDRAFEQLSSAAPLALVGMRISKKNSAAERIDRVSGKRHFYRVYNPRTVASLVPEGVRHKVFADKPYQSVVLRNGDAPCG